MSSPPSLLVSRLQELATISAGGPGVNRPGYSQKEREAHELVASWMRADGLAVHWDPAGNLHGVLKGTNPKLQSIWVGSHLDTVPAGGPLDGALGVVGGLTALVEAARQSNLPRTVELVAFACEEAARFGTGLVGSKAVTIGWERWALDRLVDREGITLGEAWGSLGLDPEAAIEFRVVPDHVSAYLELHIEQGPVLEQRGATLGVVTAIAAPSYLRAEVEGESGHAGSTPMAMRRDALCGAAEMGLFVERAARSRGSGSVATIGSMAVEPGAANVIPGRVDFSLDIRGIEASVKSQLVAEITRGLESIAESRDLKLTLRTLAEMTPVETDPTLRRLLRAAIESLGEAFLELPSGPYHDAMMMAEICPIGMLFVPSIRGRSHVPEERTEPDDLDLGVEAFARFIRLVTELAGSPEGGE
jgi:allantoate deiminase